VAAAARRTIRRRARTRANPIRWPAVCGGVAVWAAAARSDAGRPATRVRRNRRSTGHRCRRPRISTSARRPRAGRRKSRSRRPRITNSSRPRRRRRWTASPTGRTY